MKKGFNQTMHPSLIPDQYDMVYNVGMKGTVIEPTFIEKWNNLAPYKRGIIHQPVLSVKNGVNENASAFLGLLNDLSFGGWNNNIPFIVDIWEAPDEYTYSLDNVRAHGVYITGKYKPLERPLLRVIVKTWKEWYETNSTETMRLFNDYRVLLCQPKALKPDELVGSGVPFWWEYDWGLYANDPTALYEGIVKPPVVTPPEEPPVEEPPEEDLVLEIKMPTKWKISLLGGLIKGTIEAVFEDE